MSAIAIMNIKAIIFMFFIPLIFSNALLTSPLTFSMPSLISKYICSPPDFMKNEKVFFVWNLLFARACARTRRYIKIRACARAHARKKRLFTVNNAYYLR